VRGDTGFPRADVENDFQRVRRRQTLARLAHWLRREPDDVNLILPFDEVVAALGMKGERSLGLQTIPLDSIVGTVDSRRDFDRRFRPTSSRVRERWERLALAQRRGESIPPIDDLLVKSYERIFRARVPLPPQAYAKLTVSDPWSYAELGEAVEAWGFRYMQDQQRFLDRAEIARRWFAEEFTPVVRMLRAAGLAASCTDAEAYMRIARERYRLIRTHEWNDEVLEQLREKLR
jgi:hypothetical protein